MKWRQQIQLGIIKKTTNQLTIERKKKNRSLNIDSKESPLKVK